MKYLPNPLFITKFISFALLLFFCSCQGASTGSDDTTAIFEVKLTHSGSDTARQFGFDVDLPRIDQDFHLKTGNIDVPFQLEDRNQNQIPDKLYGMIDLMPGYIYSVTAESGAPTLPVSKHVQVVSQLNNSSDQVTEYSYDEDDEWQHNGIIMENNKSAFRLLMKPPFAIDVIGRRKGDLILDTVSTDLSKEQPWGGDVLREAASLGIGSPVLCLVDEIYNLSSFDSREFTVLANGPLRAAVEVLVKGVSVRDEKLDVRLYFEMQAGQHWIEVTAELLTKTDLNIQFAFGLPKHEEATPFTQGKRGTIHYAYSFGPQSAFGDHLGMALFIRDHYEIDNFLAPEHDSFYLVNPKEGKVTYRMLYAWSGGRLAITDEVQFLDLVKKYVDMYAHEPKVQVVFNR